MVSRLARRRPGWPATTLGSPRPRHQRRTNLSPGDISGRVSDFSMLLVGPAIFAYRQRKRAQPSPVSTSRQTCLMKPDRVRRGNPSISPSTKATPNNCHIKTALSTSSSACSVRCSRLAPRLSRGSLPEFAVLAGEIVMANWTPTGFIGDLFKVTGKHVAPPAGVPSPLQWGDEAAVRERLDRYATGIRSTRLTARLVFPFSVADTIEFYRVNYGPTLRAFATLSDTGQAALRRDLESLYDQHNVATDGTTSIAAEYPEVVALRK